jgi:F0F1-type ATP synthase assembly protein I
MTRDERGSRGLASRRHQTWASRWASGQGGADAEGSTGDGLTGQGTGWTIVSYLLAGMGAYGGIGWLIGRAVHTDLLFPIGMLVGLAISLAWVVYRYGLAGSDRDRKTS